MLYPSGKYSTGHALEKKKKGIPVLIRELAEHLDFGDLPQAMTLSAHHGGQPPLRGCGYSPNWIRQPG